MVEMLSNWQPYSRLIGYAGVWFWLFCDPVIVNRSVVPRAVIRTRAHLFNLLQWLTNVLGPEDRRGAWLFGTEEPQVVWRSMSIHCSEWIAINSDALWPSMKRTRSCTPPTIQVGVPPNRRSY